jgi:RimJ/RimL family protein N-acetyltransferase
VAPSVLPLLPDVRVTSLRPDHAGAMFAWMQDPEVSRNLGLRTEPTLEKTNHWIALALKDPQVCPFAIELCGKHIGNVIFDRIDRHLLNARLSVYIGEAEARGTGAGFTGLYLAIREAFSVLGLHKIWLTVHTRNARAIAVYTKLGFQVEGVLRDDFRLDGKLVPALHMGLLRRDFEELPVFVSREAPP